MMEPRTEEVRLRVLLVDDDEDDFFLVRELLAASKGSRFMVEWAPSYDKGWQALCENSYDAVLVDQELGVHTGVELIERAVDARIPAPFILLTGHGTYEVDLAAMRAGASDYLSKGEINAAFLERSLRYAVERRNSAEALRHSEERERARALEMETLMDTVPALIWIARDPQCLEMTSNRYGIDFLRVPAGVSISKTAPQPDLRQQPYRTFKDGCEIPAEELPMQVAASTGVSFSDYEFDLVFDDGSRHSLLGNVEPLFNADGQPAGAVAVFMDITGRKQTEEDLRMSEERQSAFVQNAPLGIFARDRDGRLNLANEHLLSWIGLGVEQVLGKKEAGLSLPETAWVSFINDEQVWQTGQPMSGEDEFISADGPRYFRTTKFLLPGPDGTASDLCGVVEEITDRKRSDLNTEFLARLGDRLLSLVDGQDVFKTITREVGDFLKADMTSIEEEDLQAGTVIARHIYYRAGQDASDIVLPLEIYPRELVGLLEQGQPVVIEDVSKNPLTIPLIETAYRSMNISAFTVFPRLQDGTWIGSISVTYQRPHRWRPDEISLLGSISDLAWLAVEKARLLTSLQQAEERFRVALINSPITVFTMDRDLRYTWIYNPHAMFNLPEVIGRRDEELLGAEAAAELTAVKRAAIETGQIVRREVSYDLHDTPVTFDVTIEPLRDANGEVTGLSCAAMNITKLHVLEAQRREYQAQVELRRLLMSNREQERVGIARDIHDGPLQELIAANMSLVEAVGIDDYAERVKMLRLVQHTIQTQVDGLRHFCNELRPPTLAPFGLEKAIRSHVSGIQERYPNLHVQLVLDRDRTLLSEETRIALYRIYQELFNNVLKHSGANRVRVVLKLSENQVQLIVSDNGAGFNLPEHWRDLAHHGHLGLIGIRERVELLEGRMQVNTGPGQGTSIQVVVPRAEPV